jgi:predicted Zn-dependent peptidase
MTTCNGIRLRFLLVLIVVLSLNLNPDLTLNLFDSASAATAPGLAERVVQRTLTNGMTVLMVERHQTPVVSANITFRVGGINEHTGSTGIAHLYEHMAFKGTQALGTKDYDRERPLLEELDRLNVEIERRAAQERTAQREGASESPELQQLRKRFQDVQEQAGALVMGNELAQLYQRHGAVGLNATTAKDLTRYMVALPSNRLPLWAAIEADRMANPVFREFYKERAVVMEERRLRTEDSPHGLLYEAFVAAAFQAHPYGLPTIGWASDIQSLTPAATRDFFRTFYGPGNVVLALVGDINPPEALALLERTLGKLPPSPPPPPVITVEPEQRGERRVEVEFDAEPAVLIGYHKPPIGHPDDWVFDVIDSVLADGMTSRLYEKLVREKKVAVNVATDASTPGVLAPNLFLISATPLAPHTTKEVEEAAYAELERLKTEPVTSRELEKVLNNMDANFQRSLRSNGGLASQLAYYQAVTGDWRYLLQARAKTAAVTPADIQRVAAKYFVKSNRTVATLVKPAGGRKPGDTGQVAVKETAHKEIAVP